MKNAKSNDKPANQNVSKLLQLISYLAESRGPMRLYKIAVDISMPQATALRYLNSLISEGLAFQDNLSGRYALTWKLCSIGDQVHRHLSLRSISSDIVTQLSEKLSLGICLVIEQDMECMYLDCIYEPAEMGCSLLRIGKQTPLHAASSGKILLAQHSEAQIDRFIEKKGLCKLTEHTITDKPSLMKELDIVRSQGYALDDEECEPGLRCVAVPIYGYGDIIVSAISVFGSVQKLSDGYIRQTILPPLKDAAAQISLRVGCDSCYDMEHIVILNNKHDD
jgi:IclR family transcriptional regulator, KDG regulon repressor